MPACRLCLIEPLESRQLFSAAAPISTAPTPVPSAVQIVGTGTGVTLHLQAGVGFTGQVAFIPSPAAGLGPSANIDWGDGATTPATLEVTTAAGVTGYALMGSHTYASAGTYTILSTMVLTPISPPGEPVPQFIVVKPPVISTAIVTAAAGSNPIGPVPVNPTPVGSNPSPGVVIHEIAGKQFAADLGSFTTLAPGKRLRATINWGDGKTSSGKLVAAGVVGIDQVMFRVVGKHRYLSPGAYGIAISVIKLPVGPSLAIQSIARFDAIAEVSAKA